jgi:hypothetical protein
VPLRGHGEEQIPLDRQLAHTLNGVRCVEAVGDGPAEHEETEEEQLLFDSLRRHIDAQPPPLLMDRREERADLLDLPLPLISHGLRSLAPCDAIEVREEVEAIELREEVDVCEDVRVKRHAVPFCTR